MAGEQTVDDQLKELRKSLKSIDEQRANMDAEMEAIVCELNSVPEGGGAPMGVDTPLVDREGYPRNDVDVFRARDLRRRLIELRNDHSSASRKMESGLAEISRLMNPNAEKERSEEKKARLAPKPAPKFDPVTGKWVVANWDGTVSGVPNGHLRNFDSISKEKSATAADHRETSSSVPDQSAPRPASDDEPPLPPPFAAVNSVAPDSPASAAGLEPGDLILRFGTVDASNHHDLRAVGELVPAAANERRSVPLLVSRSSTIMRLSILPRPWSGRGLVGCHIVPHYG